MVELWNGDAGCELETSFSELRTEHWALSSFFQPLSLDCLGHTAF